MYLGRVKLPRDTLFKGFFRCERHFLPITFQCIVQRDLTLFGVVIATRRDGSITECLLCTCSLDALAHKKSNRIYTCAHTQLLARCHLHDVESTEEKVGRATQAEKRSLGYVCTYVLLIDARIYARIYARNYETACENALNGKKREKKKEDTRRVQREQRGDGQEKLATRVHETCALHGVLNFDIHRRD